ncbi:MAG: orotidine-5'-phosphate decarboxylase [Betaproteobacteria bacterium]|nr:orotidine-5'-phosphate decarboxylase [Betaproteobacteria bacterium]
MNLPTTQVSGKSRNRILCLGVDPMPKSGLLKDWLDCYENHVELFDLLETKPHWVKINLAFFIRWGRLGMDKLEHACELLSPHTKVLLDGKFGEIGNSLNQYLEFAFDHLCVDGITVNPFMGEHIIGSSLQKALSMRGETARVFVLGATSEYPQNKLSAFGQSYAEIAEACAETHLALDPSGALAPHIGLVVGANRADALAHPIFKKNTSPLLMPGVGAQGVTLAQATALTRELAQDIIFPVSRSICEGGNIKPMEMKQRFESMQTELDSLTSQARRPS